MSPANRKYRILLGILDAYVEKGREVPKASKKFQHTDTDEHLNQARARAFIHLYLESHYGVGDFATRETLITDGANDGGIDAYFIDEDRRVIDVVQAKFRTNPYNFEAKDIDPGELAAVEIEKVLAGEEIAASGNKFNGRVLGLIRKISEIPNIARYRAQVTVLANVRDSHVQVVEKIFRDHNVSIINFERCYSDLVLPLLRGEQFYGDTLRLQIDLSNKSSSPRLSAEVTTRFGVSEVTVVLVPTIEIARLMTRYKNSILRFNPRSYLEFREQRTNEGIKDSILSKATGEFALLNNGITILSDETYVNERIGARNRAQVELINPQIINGGQTAFTLSRIYEETPTENRETTFSGKEVVVRIITLPKLDEVKRKDLIFEISSATNSQTQVSAVDRSASNDVNREIAAKIFTKTGLLYEPRRGEYSSAIYAGQIDRIEVLERSLFTRLIFMSQGHYSVALAKRMMKSTGGIIDRTPTDNEMEMLADLYALYVAGVGSRVVTGGDQLAVLLALTYFAYEVMVDTNDPYDSDRISKSVAMAQDLWEDLMEYGKDANPHLIAKKWNSARQTDTVKFGAASWLRSRKFTNDVREYLRDRRHRLAGNIPVVSVQSSLLITDDSKDYDGASGCAAAKDDSLVP